MPRKSFRERLFAKITIDRDNPGGCWLWAAVRNSHGYGNIWRDGRHVYAHRAVFEVYNGPLTPGMQLDHTCHVRACVNPEHLREVTNKENAENLAGARRDSRSGVRGVYWDARRGEWRVQVHHNGRNYSGGYFDDLDDAAEAARQLRLKLFTHNDKDRTEGEAAA